LKFLGYKTPVDALALNLPDKPKLQCLKGKFVVRFGSTYENRCGELQEMCFGNGAIKIFLPRFDSREPFFYVFYLSEEDLLQSYTGLQVAYGHALYFTVLQAEVRGRKICEGSHEPKVPDVPDVPEVSPEPPGALVDVAVEAAAPEPGTDDQETSDEEPERTSDEEHKRASVSHALPQPMTPMLATHQETEGGWKDMRRRCSRACSSDPLVCRPM
jgi:hypothetical protein